MAYIVVVHSGCHKLAGLIRLIVLGGMGTQVGYLAEWTGIIHSSVAVPAGPWMLYSLHLQFSRPQQSASCPVASRHSPPPPATCHHLAEKYNLILGHVVTWPGPRLATLTPTEGVATILNTHHTDRIGGPHPDTTNVKHTKFADPSANFADPPLARQDKQRHRIGGPHVGNIYFADSTDPARAGRVRRHRTGGPHPDNTIFADSNDPARAGRARRHRTGGPLPDKTIFADSNDPARAGRVQRHRTGGPLPDKTIFADSTDPARAGRARRHRTDGPHHPNTTHLFARGCQLSAYWVQSPRACIGKLICGHGLVPHDPHKLPYNTICLPISAYAYGQNGALT
jgi:hypothetical protein